jgi:hypothetical protein
LASQPVPQSPSQLSQPPSQPQLPPAQLELPPQLAEEQQTPSTQLPLAHVVPSAQPTPLFFLQPVGVHVSLPAQPQSCGHAAQLSPASHVPSPQQGEQSAHVPHVSPPLQDPSPHEAGQSPGQLELVSPIEQQPSPQFCGQSEGQPQAFSPAVQQPSPQTAWVQSPGQSQALSFPTHAPSPQHGEQSGVVASQPSLQLQVPSLIGEPQSTGQLHLSSPAPQVPSGQPGSVQSPGHDWLSSPSSQEPLPHIDIVAPVVAPVTIVPVDSVPVEPVPTWAPAPEPSLPPLASTKSCEPARMWQLARTVAPAIASAASASRSA